MLYSFFLRSSKMIPIKIERKKEAIQMRHEIGKPDCCGFQKKK